MKFDFHRSLGMILLGVASACTQTPVAAPTPAPQPQVQDTVDDPTRPIKVTVYDVRMPLGAISNNGDFWKQLDTNVFEQQTFDSLYDNGFRIGEGRLEDWPRLKPYILRENSQFSVPIIHISLSSFTWFLLEHLPDVIPRQTLWLWDEHGWNGRTFVNCKNVFAMSVQWAPRETNTVRMSICPAVQTTRTVSKFDPDFDPNTPPQQIQPQGLYDLHLRLDLPTSRFLVICPSKLSGDPDNIGHRFLVVGTPADQLEHVLIVTAGDVALPQRRFVVPTTVPSGQAVPLKELE